MNIITLDIKTAQYIRFLEEENKQLLERLFQAHTELEKRDEIKALMKQFKEIVK